MRPLPLLAFAAALTIAATGRAVEKKYGPGVTDTSIKLGQTIAYSGPASPLGSVVGKTVVAYYRMVNDQGGVNGRKIDFISTDDGYSPPKTVEQTRRLVEQEHVLAMIGSLGSPTNAAVERYLNEQKAPQLFLFTGASRFRDPKDYPWTMGGDLSYAYETTGFAEYILKEQPQAKIGILYQHDDYGKDHITALKAALGARAEKMIVLEAPYEATDPTIDSQMALLKASGADVLLDISLPKYAAQAIRKAWDLGWKPLHIISFPAASIPATLKPAGFEKSKGLVTAEFLKDPGDPTWANDPDIRAYKEFLAKYNPSADPNDFSNRIAYYHASLVVHVLAACGDTLTRDNLMFQASHMNHVQVPMLLPGITITTSPTDYSPIKQMQLMRFDGARWIPFGSVIGG